jgi:hypothetical protein
MFHNLDGSNSYAGKCALKLYFLKYCYKTNKKDTMLLVSFLQDPPCK